MSFGDRCFLQNTFRYFNHFFLNYRKHKKLHITYRSNWLKLASKLTTVGEIKKKN